ncbi:MAG: hypothetical protein GX937_05265 [Lentisphaerae bacterium]|jgi:hypothetical protein|nr:hypothetical protein [Lentisphaerota bacterium]
MNTVNLANSVSGFIRDAFQLPVSCSINEEESQIIIRVFMVPEDRKDAIEDAIYDLERKILPSRDFFFSVIVYSPNETKRYYPEMFQLKRPKVCKKGQESRLQAFRDLQDLRNEADYGATTCTP